MTAPAIRDGRSAEFFDALAAGRLLIRRCVERGHLSAPEVMFCAGCGSSVLEWVDARGDAEIVSWTAIHSRPDEHGGTTVATYVGLVELVEGPWLLARLIVDETADAAARSTVPVTPVTPVIGAAVTLQVLPTDDEPIYGFRLGGER